MAPKEKDDKPTEVPVPPPRKKKGAKEHVAADKVERKVKIEEPKVYEVGSDDLD